MYYTYLSVAVSTTLKSLENAMHNNDAKYCGNLPRHTITSPQEHEKAPANRLVPQRVNKMALPIFRYASYPASSCLAHAGT